MAKLTVFTPAYNRAYRLPDLYKSLCSQTVQDFEWLVIDDGSKDETSDLLERWSHEHKIDMRWLRVENGGKHRAINKGVKLAEGELFFIVDSDDILSDNAVEFILEKFEDIKDQQEYCGLSGSLGYSEHQRIGGTFPGDFIDCSPLDLRVRLHVCGDMAEVFKTDILRQFPFPEFEGEKFCSEALIWNRISKKFKMRFFHDIIYIAEYLEDGLSANSIRLQHSAPKASMLYYSEMAGYGVSLKERIRCLCNSWRYGRGFKTAAHLGIKSSFLSLSCWLPGKMLNLKDKIKGHC